MDTKELYREILNEHNLNPSHKAPMQDATMSLNGVNPSCGDNITLNLKIKDGIITDGSFTGQGCAVSQASCDMMLDLIIGKSQSEAERLNEIFMNMIKGSASETEIEQLDEAAALSDISKMPASDIKALGERARIALIKPEQAYLKPPAFLKAALLLRLLNRLRFKLSFALCISFCIPLGMVRSHLFSDTAYIISQAALICFE